MERPELLLNTHLRSPPSTPVPKPKDTPERASYKENYHANKIIKVSLGRDWSNSTVVREQALHVTDLGEDDGIPYGTARVIPEHRQEQK